MNLRLNKMSGEWDTTKLNDIIQELEINHFDISITGFDNIDVQELENDFEFDYNIDHNEIPEETIKEEKTINEEKPENIIICPHCGEKIEL